MHRKRWTGQGMLHYVHTNNLQVVAGAGSICTIAQISAKRKVVVSYGKLLVLFTLICFLLFRFSALLQAATRMSDPTTAS